jgi:Na+/phosphate symporter
MEKSPRLTNIIQQQFNEDISQTKSITNNNSIAIGVIVASALALIGLIYAEVKWGFISASVTWIVTHPLIMGTAITILILSGVAYGVYRGFKNVALRANEYNNHQRQELPNGVTDQADGTPDWLQPLDQQLQLAYANYQSAQRDLGTEENDENQRDFALARSEVVGIREQISREMIDRRLRGDLSGHAAGHLLLNIYNVT